MTLLCLFLHVATTRYVSILAHPILHETMSSCEMKEWIMEDMWDIKRVLESQGDVHAKVEIQSKSGLQSLTSSQSWGPRPLCLQINAHDTYDL
jgi:hypothetical protein